jgi:hypothetical protein
LSSTPGRRDSPAEPVAQRGESLRLGFALRGGKLGGESKACDLVRGECPGAQTALVATAQHLRREAPPMSR